jgi:hypothetical protein
MGRLARRFELTDKNRGGQLSRDRKGAVGQHLRPLPYGRGSVLSAGSMSKYGKNRADLEAGRTPTPFVATHATPAHPKMAHLYKENPTRDTSRVGLHVEARGIEPRSRGISVKASTCVAHLLSPSRRLAAPLDTFALPTSDKQDVRRANRL